MPIICLNKPSFASLTCPLSSSPWKTIWTIRTVLLPILNQPLHTIAIPRARDLMMITDTVLILTLFLAGTAILVSTISAILNIIFSYLNHHLNIDLFFFSSCFRRLLSMMHWVLLMRWHSSIQSILLSVAHYCLDSASDNYSIHHIAYSLDIISLIDINKRNTGSNVYESFHSISENRWLVYQAGYEAMPNGYNCSRYCHIFCYPFVRRKDNPKTIVLSLLMEERSTSNSRIILSSLVSFPIKAINGKNI